MSERSDMVHVSDDLLVMFNSGKVHLNLSAHVEGAFVCQGLLMPPLIARKLASALTAMADACDACDEEAVMDFDAEHVAIEAEYDEAHSEPEEETPTVVSLMEALEASLAVAKAKPAKP